MQKKIYFILFAAVLLSSCSLEYEPNSQYPTKTSLIEDMFLDTIADMAVLAKLEFRNQDMASVSASYGDKKSIFYQIILVTNDAVMPEDVAEEYFLPKFSEFENVERDKNNFMALVQTDSVEMATWTTGNCAFFMKTDADMVEHAVRGSKYLKLKED